MWMDFSELFTHVQGKHETGLSLAIWPLIIITTTGSNWPHLLDPQSTASTAQQSVELHMSCHQNRAWPFGHTTGSTRTPCVSGRPQEGNQTWCLVCCYLWLVLIYLSWNFHSITRLVARNEPISLQVSRIGIRDHTNRIWCLHVFALSFEQI
jgi:hypothetical protein